MICFGGAEHIADGQTTLTVSRIANVPRVVLWIFLGFEAIRLIAWLAFLIWFFDAYDSNSWVGSEAIAIPGIAALWLGFPYAFIAGYTAGSMNFLNVSANAPVAVAISNFGLWLFCSMLCIWALNWLTKPVNPNLRKAEW